MPRYTESQTTSWRSRPHFSARLTLIVISAALGTYSLFFIGPQAKALDRSISLWTQIAWAAGVAYAYGLIGFAATKDIRWAGVAAIVLGAISTPLFTLFWLMSGWSMPSFEAAMPYLGYIAGNIVMFVVATTIVVRMVTAGVWSSVR